MGAVSICEEMETVKHVLMDCSSYFIETNIINIKTFLLKSVIDLYH